jgi:hypothetical protein
MSLGIKFIIMIIIIIKSGLRNFTNSHDCKYKNEYRMKIPTRAVGE